MRLRVLGCSGGIGGRHLRTTSFLVDHDVLLDAGSGVGDLSLAELTQIDHIFVTHSHLDHVTSIPFLVDTVGGMRTRPVTVYTSGATIEILKHHLFNWAIWPDFTEIPSAEARLRIRKWSSRASTRRALVHPLLPFIRCCPRYHLDSARAAGFSGSRRTKALENRHRIPTLRC